MRKLFWTTGSCTPGKHYMVDIKERLAQMKAMVDAGTYFTINRGRQYGKTTTMQGLADYLKPEYAVISLDFQGMSTALFADERTFCTAFVEDVAFYVHDEGDGIPELELPALERLEELARRGELTNLRLLFRQLLMLCREASKPVVLLIDEVDAASNHPVFLDFLEQLREFYLKRDRVTTFHSVILAGVYSIKNLKLRLRPQSEHTYNSPWNIAVDFEGEMNFSTGEIAGMLREYEQDVRTGMDVERMAETIFAYTGGYPFLVSSICKWLDEKEGKWNREGVAAAVKELIGKRDVPLFDSLTRHLDQFPELRRLLEAMIYEGRIVPYSTGAKAVDLGLMLGYLKREDGRLAVANRMFEQYLMERFMTEECLESASFQEGANERNRFLRGGRLNMDLLMQRFAEHYHQVYTDSDEAFLEKHARKLFLLYLKPIINGTGNYYLEAQTRTQTRTDVVVDYLGEQFVVELKIWRGEAYNESGEKQLAGYLDSLGLDRGYLLTFCFGKKKKELGTREVLFEGKTLLETVV